jgi:hypothetical protein
MAQRGGREVAERRQGFGFSEDAAADAGGRPTGIPER